MRQTLHIALMSLLLLCAATFVHADEPAPTQPSVEDRLAAGEVIVTQRRVEGFSIPALTVDAVLDAPAERVWAVLGDCHGYRNTMPRVYDSVETEHAGAKTVCKWRVNMPFPFSDLETVVESRNVVTDTRWTRDYHQVSGDFLQNTGYWHLERFGEGGKRTRVYHRTFAVMATSIPDGFVKRGQVKAMHEMFGKLRTALK